MADFQQQVNVRMAPAFPGDKASDNPYARYIAGPGGLMAGTNGVTIGRFCWVEPNLVDWDGGSLLVNSSYLGLPTTSGAYGAASGAVSGFVPREQQGLNTTYLAKSGVLIPAGFMVTIATLGDFWIKNEGSALCLPGMNAFAAYATGAASFAAAGSTPTTGGSGTASSIAATATNTFTASISNNVMTVTAVSAGTIYPGAVLSGTGIATNTQVVTQLTGTAGSTGTYTVSPANQTVASTTVTGTTGTLTVGGTVTSGFAVGQLLAGTSVAAGTYITALLTGTGGAGTYIVNNNTGVSSTTITGYANVQTKWVAMTSGQPGDVVRCSAQALG